MAEFTNVGKHCSVEFCKQLDFLPFVCDGCAKTYCLDHKFPDKHSCSYEFTENTTKTYDGVRSYDCSYGECEKKELMPVICEKCQLNFCLSHRHPQEHCCTKLEMKEEKNKTALHVQKILESKQPRPERKPKKASKTAAKVALMKMKMKATGEKGIPEPEKVYLLIHLPNELALSPIPLYFSKTWSIGRCIDYSADAAKVKNENNTASEKKLSLFSHESGQLLPIESSIETLVNDEIILSGSAVILEYVTSDCCMIDNTKDYKS